jgi:hypothetical protein
MKVLQLALIAMIGMAAPMAMAQDKPAEKKPTPAMEQPGKADAKQPSAEDMKKMQDMGKAWEDAAKPGKEHEMLAKQAGTWDGTVKVYEMPGQPPSESKCTENATSIMGGRFMKCEVKGMMSMGGQMMPFEGLGIYGYENAEKKYTMCWVDNMGTAIMKGTGEASADGKTMPWTMSCTDAGSKKPISMREVDHFVSDNEIHMEMFGENPMDPKKGEMKMMEITFKRTGAAKMEEKKMDAKPADHK